jgi:hypothetical protein
MAEVKSQIMRITLDVEKHEVTSVEDQYGKPVPPVGTAGIAAIPMPPGGAGQVAILNWHRHNPNCITLNVAGGGQYQVCWP